MIQSNSFNILLSLPKCIFTNHILIHLYFDIPIILNVSKELYERLGNCSEIINIKSIILKKYESFFRELISDNQEISNCSSNRFTTIQNFYNLYTGNLAYIKDVSLSFDELKYFYLKYSVMGGLKSLSYMVDQISRNHFGVDDKNFKKLLAYTTKYDIPLILCSLIAKFGKSDCLKYALDNGYKWDTYSYRTATKTDNLDCLKYAHTHGYKLDLCSCNYAIESGSFNCLKYLHENGCALHVYSCHYAAQSGSLDCLKYVRENGCDWNEETCNYAAQFGSLDCLKYAFENGCKYGEYARKCIVANGWNNCEIHMGERN